VRFWADEAQRALAVLRTRADIAIPVSRVQGVTEDGEDDLVIATVVAGGAGILVTGDRYLQAPGRFKDARILIPRQFLEILESEDHGVT
jgi:predicted nucleic acid-binding protein